MAHNKKTWLSALVGSALVAAMSCATAQATVWTLPQGGYIPPDAQTGGTFGSSSFTITVSGEQPILTALQVRLAIAHPATSDLRIILQSPAGTQIALASYRGLGENYQDTLFDDFAPTFISAGISPFIGTYKPESGINNSLSVFNDENPNGNWTFLVFDDAFLDSGYLFGTVNDITAPWQNLIGTTLYITSTNQNGGGPINPPHGEIPEPITAGLSLLSAGAMAVALLRRR